MKGAAAGGVVVRVCVHWRLRLYITRQLLPSQNGDVKQRLGVHVSKAAKRAIANTIKPPLHTHESPDYAARERSQLRCSDQHRSSLTSASC
jgi:hypothetical protein